MPGDADWTGREPTDAEIEGRGLLALIGYGLGWVWDWVLECLGELIFGWW